MKRNRTDFTKNQKWKRMSSFEKMHHLMMMEWQQSYIKSLTANPIFGFTEPTGSEDMKSHSK